MPTMSPRSLLRAGQPPRGRTALLLGGLLVGVWLSGGSPNPEAGRFALATDGAGIAGPRIPAAAEAGSGVLQGRADTLHVGVIHPGGLRPLPPSLLSDEVERWVMAQVYGPGLLSRIANGRSREPEGSTLQYPAPRLVSEYVPDEETGGGGGITFTIQSGIRFQNGETLTARNLEATFAIYRGLARLGYPAIDPAFAYIDSTESPSPETFILWMPPGMLEQGYRLAAAPILPTELTDTLLTAGDMIAALDRIVDVPIGLGGYQIANRPDRVLLTAFPDYFDGSPRIRNIVVHFYGDDSALIRAFMTGEIQFARMPTWKAIQRLNEEVKNSPELLRRSNVRFYAQPDHFFYLALNNTIAPLDDPVMRRVFGNIIHREHSEFRDEPFAHSVITDIPIHPKSVLGDYLPTPTRRHQPRSFVLRHLRESDLNLTRTGYPRAADDSRFSLELIYPDHIEHYETMARRIKNDLENYQFLIDVIPLAPREIEARLRAGTYELALFAMTLPPTPDVLYRLYASEYVATGLNLTRYTNQALDAALLRALWRRGDDWEASLENAFRILYEEMPLLPLFYQANVYYFFNNALVEQETLGPSFSLMQPMAEWRWR